jgi:hypothetical protein
MSVQPKRPPTKLPPHVEGEVRRILARAARRLLAKRLQTIERGEVGRRTGDASIAPVAVASYWPASAATLCTSTQPIVNEPTGRQKA